MNHPQLQEKLTRELTPLRKGKGATPLKLQSAATLRRLASQATLTPIDSLTDNQVYNFLLYTLSNLPVSEAVTAIKNAIGVNSPLKTLAARRSNLANTLGKHPDTIERYENQGIHQLAAYLTEHYLLSHAENPLTAPPLRAQETDTHANATRTMTTIGLASHLSLPSHADDLMKYLEMPRRPYIDATIHITLLPSSRGIEWYRFRLAYLFQGGRESFRVAVVLNITDGEQLMADGLVDDYHRLDSHSNARRDIKTIIACSKLTIRNPQTGTQKLLRLREARAGEVARTVSSASKPLLDSCWLLEITIPLQWQTKECTYEYLSWINLPIASVVYWYAPTLMYLKKLTLDFSKFPNVEKREFFLLPFLGHAPGTELVEKYLYILNLNNWIMPGHGIVLGWQNPSKPQNKLSS